MRRFWTVLDCAMLIAIVVLQAWRLTGVVLHEWLAVAVIAAVLVHLVLHWPWVRSRGRRILRPHTGRTRVNYALNAIVFAAMAVAMISGFAISKAVIPAHPDPASYLKWHGIHDVTSRIALIAIGLHLALNWELMFAHVRSRLHGRYVMPVLVWVAIASAVAGTAAWAVERNLPAQDVTMIQPDGKRVEHAPPPPDIAEMHPGEAAPSMRGLPALLPHGILIALACVVGRKILRLRLD